MGRLVCWIQSNPTTHIHPKLFFTKHRSTMNKFRHKRSFEWKRHENDWFSQFYEQRSKIVLISIDNRENTHRCHHGSLMTLRKCTRFIEKYTETVRVELRACMLLLLVRNSVSPCLQLLHRYLIPYKETCVFRSNRLTFHPRIDGFLPHNKQTYRRSAK